MRVLIDRGIPAAFWRKLLTGPVLPGNERFYVSGPNQTVVWELKVYLSFRRFVDASIENGGGDQTARVISISSALYLAGASDTRGGEGVPIHRANFLRSSTLAART